MVGKILEFVRFTIGKKINNIRESHLFASNQAIIAIIAVFDAPPADLNQAVLAFEQPIQATAPPPPPARIDQEILELRHRQKAPSGLAFIPK